MRLSARIAAAALVVAVAGCKAASPGATVSCSPPECPADSTLLLVAEVDPPSDSQLVRQEFGSVSIDPQSGLFALAFDQQVSLTGSVRVGSGNMAKPVAATVVATRPSRIIGRPDVVYQGTVDPDRRDVRAGRVAQPPGREVHAARGRRPISRWRRRRRCRCSATPTRSSTSRSRRR